MSSITPRLQFGIGILFCVTTAVAILCVLVRLEGACPYSTLLPGMFFVGACAVARGRGSADMAWSLFAIGWLIAYIQVVQDWIQVLFVVIGNNTPSSSEVQRAIVIVYVLNLGLPLCLSVPAVCRAIRVSRGARSIGRKWIILCPIIGFVDVAVLTAGLVALSGYDGSR